MEYKEGIKCIKCGGKILTTSKSERYCGFRCSKLYLKSLYRKRHSKGIALYKKTRRMLGYRSMYKSIRKNELTRSLLEKQGRCLKCGSEVGLEIHHIRPRIKGGKHEIGNIMLLCHKCHYHFEELTRGFWE
jgi:5-methylcytosine-specific restriction endonuclease McrA